MEVKVNSESVCDCDKSFLAIIPTELRVMIYMRMPYEDILRTRLVSHKIKQEIDQHLEFHIRLDQAYRGFRKLCRYRVKSCVVAHLTHQHLHRRGLFAFPIRLKKAVFDGSISPANLIKILSHCTEIENLVFTHETLGIDNLLHSVRVEQCLQRNLNLVTRLNVQLLRYPLGNPFDFENNMKIIFSLTLPNLKAFKLYFSLWGNWLPLLKFLERHSKTLNELELQVGDRGDAKNTEIFLNSNNHAGLKNCVDINILKTLQFLKFNFRDDVLNLNSTVKQILIDILQQQRALQIFQFHSPGEMTTNHLSNIISRNEPTLTEVVVYNLKNFIEIPNININNNNDIIDAIQGVPQGNLIMNMSNFQRCCNLKTLALSCTPPNGHNGVDVRNIRIINIDCIPSTIERMHLTGFLLDIEETIRLSTRCINLKELLLADSGTMKYSSLIGCFLKNCTKLEYLNIRPVVTRANGDSAWFKEVKELSKLYMHFMGTPFDPIDDLDGFEAKITEFDRAWINDNLPEV